MWYGILIIYEINENGRKVKKQIYTDFTLDDWGVVKRKNSRDLAASDEYYLKRIYKAREEVGYIQSAHILDFKKHESKLEAKQILKNIKNHTEMVLNQLGIFPEVEFTITNY